MNKTPRYSESYALQNLKTPCVLTSEVLEAWVNLRKTPDFKDVTLQESQVLPDGAFESYKELWLHAAFWRAIDAYGHFILLCSILTWLACLYSTGTSSLALEMQIAINLVVSYLLLQIASPFSVVFSSAYTLNRDAWSVVYDYLLEVDRAGSVVRDRADVVAHNQALLRVLDFGVSSGIVKTPSPVKGLK